MSNIEKIKELLKDIKQHEFLIFVSAYVDKNLYMEENLTYKIFEAVSDGTARALEQYRKQSIEMESIALAAAAEKFSNPLEFIRQKINMNKRLLCFNWDWVFDEKDNKK